MIAFTPSSTDLPTRGGLAHAFCSEVADGAAVHPRRLPCPGRPMADRLLRARVDSPPAFARGSPAPAQTAAAVTHAVDPISTSRRIGWYRAPACSSTRSRFERAPPREPGIFRHAGDEPAEPVRHRRRLEGSGRVRGAREVRRYGAVRFHARGADPQQPAQPACAARLRHRSGADRKPASGAICYLVEHVDFSPPSQRQGAAFGQGARASEPEGGAASCATTSIRSPSRTRTTTPWLPYGRTG